MYIRYHREIPLSNNLVLLEYEDEVVEKMYDQDWARLSPSCAA